MHAAAELGATAFLLRASQVPKPIPLTVAPCARSHCESEGVSPLASPKNAFNAFDALVSTEFQPSSTATNPLEKFAHDITALRKIEPLS